jgi:hypothetical protein
MRECSLEELKADYVAVKLNPEAPAPEAQTGLLRPKIQLYANLAAVNESALSLDKEVECYSCRTPA